MAVTYTQLEGHYTFVATIGGAEVSGTAWKRDIGTGWSAVIQQVNGVPHRAEEGGVLSGHADTRKAAVGRVLESYALGASGRWLRVMNH